MSLAENLGSDPMHDSRRDSFRNSFFYVGCNFIVYGLQIKPSWRLMEQFVVVNMQAIAFQADDDENQHSMNSDVDNPVSIKKKFDDIAYSKGKYFHHKYDIELYCFLK